MPVEAPIDGIESLNTDWPLDEDKQLISDDNHRLIKEAVQKSFVELASSGGAVNASAAEFNNLVGTTGPIQDQLNAGATSWQVVTAASVDVTENSAYLCEPPSGGQAINLPAGPTPGVQVEIIDGLGTAATDNITVDSLGSEILYRPQTGQTGPVTVNENGANWLFVFATSRWTCVKLSDGTI